jgi:HlyD family secretion protein
MRTIGLKRIVTGLLVVAAGALLVLFAWPQPVAVDMAEIVRGSMTVEVEDQGRTRVRHVYTVSAPIAGKVLRTPRYVGDEVAADETIVAAMQPMAPAFLDARTREELQAALVAAEAGIELAEHEIHRITAAHDFAQSELRRAEELARKGVISSKTLDKARFDAETGNAALSSAKAQLDMRRSERASVMARLGDPSPAAASDDSDWRVELRAPVNGRVLRIVQESESVVQAGTPLIEIGDPADIEVVTDLLSTDAVQIEPGASVRIDGWGGATVRGKVARIDPAGFTKISTLGIEEQRVRTVIDLVDPPETWSRLGHDFHVVVHVTAWSAEEAIAVPVAALFRKGDNWAVYAVRDGRARITPVEIGRRNNRVAEVRNGLEAGDRVVLHPSDRVEEGTAVAERVIR